MVRKLSAFLALLGLVLCAGATQAQGRSSQDVHAYVSGIANTPDGAVLFQLVDMTQTFEYGGHTYSWTTKQFMAFDLSTNDLLGWSTGDAFGQVSKEQGHAVYEGTAYCMGAYQPFEFDITADSKSPSGWRVSYSCGDANYDEALRAGSSAIIR